MTQVRGAWRALGLGLCLTCVLQGFVSAEATGARVLLTGEELSAWRGDTGTWENAGDAIVSPENEKLLATKPGSGILVNGPDGKTRNLLSKAEFGDVRAHIEFMVPKGSNSGVYFQGRYEVQILDSWGVAHPTYTDCGGIYQRWDTNRDPKGFEGHGPRVNASRRPGAWQTFDVLFRAPRFDASGKKTANARFVQVIHNGQLVHENVGLNAPTRASAYQDEKPLGPLMLQGDHGPVAYRNVRIVPLKPEETCVMNPFFAMDTGTKDANHTTAKAQVEMLEELGYAGIGYTAFDGLPELLRELDTNGLQLFTDYIGATVEPDRFTYDPGLKEGVKLLTGRNTMLWITVNSSTYGPSSPDGDPQAVAMLREIADLAAEHGLRVALYPHTGCWLESVADAVRVAKKVDRENVGATFNLCHWLKVDKGQDMKPLLAQAMPHLFVVTINGADKDGANWDRLIQTLDRGSFDVQGFLHTLINELGYTGPIGLQGYGIKGDAHENLKRSMNAWRALSQSVAAGGP